MEPTNTSLAGLAGLRRLACEKEGAKRGRRVCILQLRLVTLLRWNFVILARREAQATRRGAAARARCSDECARERNRAERDVRVCVCVCVGLAARSGQREEGGVAVLEPWIVAWAARETHTHPPRLGWKMSTKSIVVLARSIPQSLLHPPRLPPLLLFASTRAANNAFIPRCRKPPSSHGVIVDLSFDSTVVAFCQPSHPCYWTYSDTAQHIPPDSDRPTA